MLRLVAYGVDLDDAIESAPKKDGGFSPLTLAWVLQNFDVVSLSSAAGLSNTEAEPLDRFRGELIDRLLSRS